MNERDIGIHDVGTFLRARRAAVRPEERGLPDSGNRRVPGLRREELARLAGVSVEYYVRIEQGRTPNVSDQVLDAIAGVLDLSDASRAHLRVLARGAALPHEPDEPLKVPASVLALLDAMESVPAYVLGRRSDVLAWNHMANAALGCGGWGPNAARFVFLDPRARDLYVDWEHVAAQTAAFLASDIGCHPEDAELASLVVELADANETFARFWARHEVLERYRGRQLVRHPIAGELDLGFESLAIPDEPNMIIFTLAATLGTPSAQRLAALRRLLSVVPDSAQRAS